MSRLEDVTNRIISASASLIAVVALCTAIYQAKLSREQAKAAVWPYLIQGNSSNSGYARIIQNVGLGPAIIKSFEVRVDDLPVHSWKEAADSLHITLSGRGMKSTTIRAGIVLPTGPLVEVVEYPDSADARALSGLRDRLDTRLCYCSLYGDCWSASGADLEPKATKRCTDNPALSFHR
jgi:hypothetical protein